MNFICTYTIYIHVSIFSTIDKPVDKINFNNFKGEKMFPKGGGEPTDTFVCQTGWGGRGGFDEAYFRYFYNITLYNQIELSLIQPTPLDPPKRCTVHVTIG